MAAEAIGRIKQAEDKGGETIRNAQEAAKEILKSAQKVGGEKKQKILQEAREQYDKLIQKAQEEAETECAPLWSDGKKEMDKILNPEIQLLNRAVGKVVERIVSADGNR